MAFISHVQVEAAMANLAKRHPAHCELLTFPNRSAGKQRYHAMRIGKAVPSGFGVLILGAMHGDEAGTADACIRLATDLLGAFGANTGVAYGNKSFQAEDIASIKGIDVFVVPVVNPDGLKSRSRSNANNVNLNRNFDFLWNTQVHFDPQAFANNGNDNPADKNYRGSYANSEHETLNLIQLVKQFPQISFVLDLHTGDLAPKTVLFSWSDDETQTNDPTMNFQNPAFDGMRGNRNSGYREYLPPGQLAAAMSIANTIAEAMSAAHGQPYSSVPGPGYYANGVGGIAVDYFSSRQFVDPQSQRIMGLGVEMDYQHAWTPESVLVIEEGSAGALALCVRTANMARVVSSVMANLPSDPPLMDFFRNHLDLLRGTPKEPIPPPNPAAKRRRTYKRRK